MVQIDCLEFHSRTNLTAIGIVTLPLEIDISGVFRKGPCGKTRDNSLACSEPGERRMGLHAKNLKSRACQGFWPNPVILAAIAIGQERGRFANLTQDDIYSLIKTAAADP